MRGKGGCPGPWTWPQSLIFLHVGITVTWGHSTVVMYRLWQVINSNTFQIHCIHWKYKIAQSRSLDSPAGASVCLCLICQVSRMNQNETLLFHRPLFRPAWIGDNEPAVRGSAQIHPSSRQRVRLRQRRLAAHPSAAARGRPGPHMPTGGGISQVLL